MNQSAFSVGLSGLTPPRKLRFPEAAPQQPWLSALLDAYFIADQGIYRAVERAARQGKTLACARGCANCCKTHLDIPVYPVELVGIYWYVTENIEEPRRAALKDRLEGFQSGQPCPFLLEEVCAIHPMRPLACRHFNVFGRACAPGEDAYYTRREDVMQPLKSYQEQALAELLRFHQVRSKGERRKMVESGQIHALAKVLQELDWNKLAQRMTWRSALAEGLSTRRQ